MPIFTNSDGYKVHPLADYQPRYLDVILSPIHNFAHHKSNHIFWNTVISRDKSETLCDAGHRIAASPEDAQPGTVVLILRLNTVIPCPRRYSIHGDKDRHLSCTSAVLRLEQLPDIILFRDCILHSFSYSYCQIVVLDRTVSDFYIASLRCRTSNIRVAERCATGDGCSHLTTEHGHSVSRRDSIHGDKDRHLSCACATLRLEQMPDIILFRDCTLLSFLFLPFSCFPRFFIMMPFSKVRHF